MKAIFETVSKQLKRFLCVHSVWMSLSAFTPIPNADVGMEKININSIKVEIAIAVLNVLYVYHDTVIKYVMQKIEPP